LPLTAVDLATVEAYKKAIRLEAARIGTQGIKFWVYRDVELPTAAGKKQKLPVFIALADDTAIKPLLKSGTLACRGMCALRGGKIAFDSQQGVVPYNLLRTAVPVFFGKNLLVPLPVPGGPARPGGGATAANGAATLQLTAALRQISQKAAQRKYANPAERAAFAKAMASVPELLRTSKLPEAKKRIEQLNTMLKAPPAPPRPPAGGPSGPRYADLNATWKQLSQKATQRMSAHPAGRAAFTKAMAGIPELLRGGKLPDAKKRLDQLEAMLKVPPPPPPPPPGGGPKYAELNATWKQVSQKATQRMSANPWEKEAFTKAMVGIPDLLRGGKLPEAKKRIEQLQADLKVPPKPDPKVIQAQTAAWKKLDDQVKKAIAAHPDRKAELVRASAGIADMIRVGKSQLAQQLMDKVTALLKKL